jgi:hypothetical protein
MRARSSWSLQRCRPAYRVGAVLTASILAAHRTAHTRTSNRFQNSWETTSDARPWVLPMIVSRLIT